MADKSPRHSMSKKSGKSIKEKRVERKAKADTTPQMERLTRDKKP
jgi:ribosomal protein S8E